MKLLGLICATLIAAAISERTHALDAPPPPDPKTLQWTIELANTNIPTLTTRDTPISALLGGLESSMAMPGFYLDIDFSAVEERTKEEISIELEELTWLEAVAHVADLIDADIEIRPGVIRLVPRQAPKTDSSEYNGEQGVDPNA